MLLCISVLYILLYLATSSPAFPSTAGSLLRKQNLRSSSNVTEQDRFWMRHALQLALQARGRTRPNPCVGCVIVDADNKIVGEGFHERAGGPHAEVHALRQAGDRAVNGTAYVTLEPCNHYGRTPPCTLALLK